MALNITQGGIAASQYPHYRDRQASDANMGDVMQRVIMSAKISKKASEMAKKYLLPDVRGIEQHNSSLRIIVKNYILAKPIDEITKHDLKTLVALGLSCALQDLVSKGLRLPEGLIFTAAKFGNIGLLEYLKLACSERPNYPHWPPGLISQLAMLADFHSYSVTHKKLDVIKWLLDKGCKWNKHVPIYALDLKEYEIIRFAVTEKLPGVIWADTAKDKEALNAFDNKCPV